MIISHKHRFIFIKSRKTAGSSIQNALAGHCDQGDVITGVGFEQQLGQIGGKNMVHMPAADLRKVLSSDVWDHYYKFCFIRNPWDLTVSRYFWDLKKERTQENVFAKWVKSQSDSDWKKDKLTPYSHIGKNLAVDFVGRYERLNEDFATVCEAVGIPCPELPHEKARHVEKKHYSTYYDDQSIEIVRRHHQDSIDCFGYQFERA